MEEQKRERKNTSLSLMGHKYLNDIFGFGMRTAYPLLYQAP